MKNVKTARLATAKTTKKPVEILTEFDVSSSEQQEYVTQENYVPLHPTETGRKRHDAHQMRTPKFMEPHVESQQTQHSEIYLG